MSEGGAVGNELWSADMLARLRALFLSARKRRRQHPAQQAPIAAGSTRELKDFRRYVPGDDVRAIDWRLFARLERLYVRVFEEVREAHVHLVVDCSRSMAEPFPDKRLAALRLTGGLAYLALLAGHQVSLYTLGASIRRDLGPLRGQGHIHRLLAQLAALPMAGAGDPARALGEFRPLRDRRHALFVVSDLLGPDPQAIIDTLRHQVSWPRETHVIQVLASEEVRPVGDGEVLLQDVETAEVRRLALTPRDLEEVAARVAAYLEEIRRACVTRHLGYIQWSAALPVEPILLDLIARTRVLSPQ